jgi:Bacterial Ig-like domain (group 2)
VRSVAVWLAAVLVGISACSREPVSSPVSSPSSSPVSPTPVAPVPPVPTVNENLVRVWLCCGSAQVDISRQRQLEVRASYRDGSSEDVTAEATGWKSSNPSIASVSPTGVVSGLTAGNFEITASYGGLDATWGLSVVQSEFRPPAADEVTGVVSELTPVRQ